MIEQQILDGAPYGADEFFIFHGVVNYIDNHENGHQFKIWHAECEEWVFSELVYGWQYIRGRRSLSDIKTIVDLKKRIAELENKNANLEQQAIGVEKYADHIVRIGRSYERHPSIIRTREFAKKLRAEAKK